MKRVYCLYRVSTTQQVDVVKDDIPMQRIACHDFAARMGWTILVEKEEKGISGFKVSAEEAKTKRRLFWNGFPTTALRSGASMKDSRSLISMWTS